MQMVLVFFKNIAELITYDNIALNEISLVCE